MRILFDINHPADVHFFRHAIAILKRHGHHVLITARDKDVALPLLQHYGLPYRKISTAGHGYLYLGSELLSRNLTLLRIYLSEHVDVGVAFTGTSVAQVGFVLRRPSLVFYDNEEARLQNLLTYPFATRIFTPRCYTKDLGAKQDRFSGIKELAYLHPRYYTPDAGIFAELGLPAGAPYVIVRLVAWAAAHDIGASGVGAPLLRRLIAAMSPHARVFVVPEGAIPPDLSELRLPVSADRIHHALHFASLYVGEGATMACEAACLGTPAIYINSLKPSHVLEVEQAGLVFHLAEPDAVVSKAVSILTTTSRDHWRQLAHRFAAVAPDLPQWIADRIEGPLS